MEREHVQRVFDEHWRQGWGSISVEDAMYIQSKIRQARPRNTLEIGMASGISAGVIALFMAENGGEKLVTIDHDNTFFGDPTRENGFLIEAIVGDAPIHVVKRPFTVALDIPTFSERPFDLAFVDANHQHPWPLLDTMCLYPYLEGDRIVIYDDLAIYKDQPIVLGIGPKFLYDQIPGPLREVGDVVNKSIFALRLMMGVDRMEDVFEDAILIPWSIRGPLNSEYVERHTEFLAMHYSERSVTAFQTAVGRFNRQDRLPGHYK